MAQIKGTNVASPVVPFDTADENPSHEARYGKGGYRTVATTTERDAIAAPRREAGMLVFVTDDDVIYQLSGDLTTWSPLETGGGGGQPDAHASTHGEGGTDPVTIAGSQISGGALPANATLTFSDGTNDAEIGGWGFGVEVSADGNIYATVEPSAVTVHGSAGYAALQSQAVYLSNGTSLTVGTFDSGRSGASGISLVCAVGYELNWQAGYLKCINANGTTRNILVESPLEFPGEGADNVQIDAAGITFADGSQQTSAYDGTVPAHAASHAAGGADALTPADIGAAAASHTHVPGDMTNTGGEIAVTGGGSWATGESLVDFAYGVFTGIASRASTSHAHGNITSAGAIGTTSGLIVTTGTNGVLGTLAQGTAGQYLRVNSGATGVEWVTLGSAASASTSDFAAASHNHAASAITSGTLDIARIPTGTSSTTVAPGDHTHAQLHDRSHAITSSSDHTATAWRVFYSNGSGVVTELSLGSAGQALLSNGASAAPSWGSAGSNSASDLTVGTLAYARMADPTVTSPSQIAANQNNYASFARGINRFTTDAARDITGMVAGSDGEVRVLTNVGTTAANTLTIKDESSSSTAANRFSVPWNGDCVIAAESSVVVFYDGTSSRWRVV